MYGMEKAIQFPHDKYFKNIMADKRVAKEFFTTHLPANIRDIIDLNDLELTSNSFVDEKLKRTESDIVFSATFNKKEGYLFLLVEHQSSPDKLMPLRIMKYMLSLVEQHIKISEDGKSPVIYPLIFFNGDKPYPYSTDIFDLFADIDLAKDIFFKPIQIIDLNTISDEKLKEHLWSGVMQFIMKHIKAKDIKYRIEEILDHIKEIDSLDGESYLTSLFSYAFEVGTTKNPKKLMTTISNALSEKNRSKVMPTIAEYLRKEARKEALQQGMQQGMQQGEQEKIRIIISLLNKGVDTKIVSESTGLSVDKIEQLKEKEVMH